MKKIVGLILVLMVLVGETFAQYGPVNASTLRVRKAATLDSNMTVAGTATFAKEVRITGITTFTATPVFSAGVTATGRFVSDQANGTPRFTVGTVAGTATGNIYADTAHFKNVNIGFGRGTGVELHPLTVGGTLAAGSDRFTVDTTGLVTCIGLTTTGAITATAQTLAAGVSTLRQVDIGFGLPTATELHPLSVGGTLAAGANRFTVDTLGNVNGVIATFTGNSILTKLSIGSASAGRALLDSIQLYGTDSLGVWVGGARFVFGKTVYK
jgi:hypothetical protein